MSVAYESPQLLGQYLLLHYGKPDEVLPWSGGPGEALGYPVRCAARLGRAREGRRTSRFLDLGCAVGRSTFEGLRWAEEAVGLDYSATFIDAAGRLAREGKMDYVRVDEGDRVTGLRAEVPVELPRMRAMFRRGDACRLEQEKDLGVFDAVLLANLLCRLPDPAACLRSLAKLVVPGGTVLITTPCSWMEEFTPKEAWLGGNELPTLEGIRANLEADFEWQSTEEMPFLIREHARKYQWSVAQASVWQKR